jgi:hypothetical protein
MRILHRTASILLCLIKLFTILMIYIINMIIMSTIKN